MINIPVCYGKEYGPYLEYVSSYTVLTPREVITLHSQGQYRLNFLGFSPGFPYLSGLDSRLTIPRRDNPRLIVERGSVAIGGCQSGIYSTATPGG